MSPLNIEDNYLSPNQYLGHPTDEDGFARFVHPENGQWYFAWFQFGELILRSEGYQLEAGRDNGIDSVKKYKDDNANYRVRMQPDGQWVLELWASNNKEIARSDRFHSEEEARLRLPSALAARMRMSIVSEFERAHEDDYLACKDYENQPRIPDHREFCLFDKDGEYYFGYLGKGNEVLLRSEGYKSEDGRVNGMQSILRNKGNHDRYRIEEKMGYYFVVLTAGNRKEIARSCPKTQIAALALIDLLLGVVIPIAPAAAATPLFAAAAPVAPPPPTETKRNWSWLWWLLLLLLLLILYCLWKGCNKEAVIAEPPATTTPVDTTPAPTPAPTPPKVDYCIWHPIHFEYGNYVIPDTARKYVQNVVDLLKSNAAFTATFIGYTDDRGSAEFNLGLSQRRATAAKDLAVQLGIDPSRITISKQDESNAEATNDSEAGRLLNRRVVMYVYDADKKPVCNNVEVVVPEELKPE